MNPMAATRALLLLRSTRGRGSILERAFARGAPTAAAEAAAAPCAAAASPAIRRRLLHAAPLASQLHSTSIEDVVRQGARRGGC